MIGQCTAYGWLSVSRSNGPGQMQRNEKSKKLIPISSYDLSSIIYTSIDRKQAFI